jgi:CBS domain-containing protein
MFDDVDKVSIEPDATVSDALRRMVEIDAGRLLVVDGARLHGLITRSGITRFVQLKTQLDEEDQDRAAG